MKNLSVLIMAAGKGTRMVSSRAKVLHAVCGVPMVVLIYRAAARLGPGATFVVVGHDADRVRASLEGCPVRFVHQEKQLGTGHAVMVARNELEGLSGDLLVMFGDTPRIRTETLDRLVERHQASTAATTLLTTRVPDPFGYGRIIRASDGSIAAIVEQKDATPEQRKVDEINPGFYCFRIPELLSSLEKLTNDNAQREYYITDLIGIQRKAGLQVDAIMHEDHEELRGINTRRELAEVSRLLMRQKKEALMAAGVTFIDPENAYLDLDVEIERDVTLYPSVFLEGTTRIGEGTTVRAGVRISSSNIGNDVQLLDSCVITDSEIGRGSVVGPSAHLRNGAVIGEDCRIGNFVEVKNSRIGDRSMAAHLSYIGDAQIGADVNIGAGVITCNYDGFRKNATIVEDHAFIGTDSQLVAPVRIGSGAFVAAGSCITEDVPAGALGVARSRQTNKPGWVRKRNERLRND
jgi:bifunctional UDP-N-acetylglucosamine pyrophosphorylase / glucosamine-1-phosphate N-acetyltransferase